MQRDEVLTLCSTLADAGIWIALTEQGTLTVGPTHLLHEHPELLSAARDAKVSLMEVLEETLVHDLFLTKDNDPRFAQEPCPACGRSCYIISPPRRLESHRLPDGTTVCPGSERAQTATAQAIMDAFLNDCAVPRRMAVLTWTSLKGSLESWCRERGFLLPPRPYIVTYMDSHFDRQGDDALPRWAGLTLTLQEWGLDEGKEETRPVVPPKPRKSTFTAR